MLGLKACDITVWLAFAFETTKLVALVGLELYVETRSASNSHRFICLCILSASAGTKNVCHQALALSLILIEKTTKKYAVMENQGWKLKGRFIQLEQHILAKWLVLGDLRRGDLFPFPTP